MHLAHTAVMGFLVGLAFFGGAALALFTVLKAPAVAFATSVVGMVTLNQAGTAVVAVGAFCAALVATAAAIRLPVIRAPFLWLWKRNVADPAHEKASGWMAAQLSPVIARFEALERRLAAMEQRISRRDEADPPG